MGLCLRFYLSPTPSLTLYLNNTGNLSEIPDWAVYTGFHPPTTCSCANPTSGNTTIVDSWQSGSTSIATITSGGTSSASVWKGVGVGSTTSYFYGNNMFLGGGSLLCQAQQPADVSPIILLGSTDVTNRTSTVIVGQQITLSVSAGGTLSSVSWTVPGTIVGGYAGSTSGSGQTSGTKLAQTPTTFYWVDSGSSRTVTVKVVLSSGASGSASATFNVVAPTGSMSATALTSANISIDTSCGYLCAHYGPSGSSGGVHFANAYTVPSGYTGTFQWVQVGTTSGSRTSSSTGTTQSYGPCGGVDTTYPYDTHNPTNDSPVNELNSGYKDRRRGDSFTMTLMFQPTSASSIFVPIAEVPWSWGFDATSGDGGLTWTFASKTAAGILSPSPTTNFPTWATNLDACGF